MTFLVVALGIQEVAETLVVVPGTVGVDYFRRERGTQTCFVLP